MVYSNKYGKVLYTVKKHGKRWFSKIYSIVKKLILVHKQVPDAAYDNNPDQCAHHNLHIAQKHGKTLYRFKKMVNEFLQ